MTHRTRARNALAAGLLGIVGFSAAFNLLMRTTMPEWAEPEYGIRMKRLRAEAARDRTKPIALALGSSRLQMGLDPESAICSDWVLLFNGGQSGCGSRQTLRIFRSYRADGVMPAALIIEILPALLTGDLPERDGWYETCLPWSAYRGNLLSYAGVGRYLPQSERCDHLWKRMKPGGWMPYFHESITDDKRAAGLAVAHAEYAPKLRRHEIAADVRASIDELRTEAKAWNTPVCFVLLPESLTFRGWSDPGFESMLQAYLEELRQDAEVFDARSWFDDEDCFADGHHMMRRAACAFSRRFGEVHLEPWLRRNGLVSRP